MFLCFRASKIKPIKPRNSSEKAIGLQIGTNAPNPNQVKIEADIATQAGQKPTPPVAVSGLSKDKNFLIIVFMLINYAKPHHF